MGMLISVSSTSWAKKDLICYASFTFFFFVCFRYLCYNIRHFLSDHLVLTMQRKPFNYVMNLLQRCFQVLLQVLMLVSFS